MRILSSSVNFPFPNQLCTEPYGQYSMTSAFSEQQIPLNPTMYLFLKLKKFCASVSFDGRNMLYLFTATVSPAHVPL